MEPLSTLLTSLTSDGIFTITLNRPPLKNAFNSDMYNDFTKALKLAKREEKVLAVILTGSGSLFSSGADLKQGVDLGEEVESRNQPVGNFMWELMHFPKPVIACVNGPAVGIGFTLLMHCDIVYCVQDTYFWSPFARIALVPEFASSLLFREAFGISLSNELLLAGKKLTAEEALQSRFVSKVLPGNKELMQQGFEMARQMLAYPLPDKTLPLYKKMLKYPARMNLLENIHEMEMNLLSQRMMNGETAEGVGLFLQQQAQEKKE